MPNFRPLWRCCEELMPLRDFSENRIFSFIKGIRGILRGKWVAAAKFLAATNFCSYFLQVLTEILLWCKFQVFWIIFGWFRAHFRSKSGIFPSNFIKGKSHKLNWNGRGVDIRYQLPLKKRVYGAYSYGTFELRFMFQAEVSEFDKFNNRSNIFKIHNN